MVARFTVTGLKPFDTAAMKCNTQLVRSMCENVLDGKRVAERDFRPSRSGRCPTWAIGLSIKAFSPRAGFFPYASRAAKAHNDCAPHRRITKRVDNHGNWIQNRVALKGLKRLTSLQSAVNRAGVTARGFVWLTVSREIPKAPSRAYSGDVQCNRFPLGFCLQPPATFPAMVQLQSVTSFCQH